MTEKLDITRLHVARSLEGDPFCVVSLANESLWTVATIFDRKNALEFIGSIEGIVNGEKLKEFVEVVERAKLPSSHCSEPILISNYAAMVLARAVNTYLEASSQKFNLYSGWPLLTHIPTQKFFYYLAMKRFWQPSKPQYEKIFNGLLGFYDPTFGPVIHVLNSREQWRDLLLDYNDLSNRELALILRDLDDAVMVEKSSIAPLRIVGELAVHISKIVWYDLHINSIVARFGGGFQGVYEQEFDVHLS